ncbi:MAG TPA: RNA polymerase sigma factor [Acidobacteriaceae bacterium]|nr:RNA polymerase sigma factor [Acidobacteriaceae bacterium]
MGTMAAEMAGPRVMTDVLRTSSIEEMTALISERLPYFHRVAKRRLDNMADAEDAVQDAFLSAWKHLDKFKGESRMSTWMTVVVMNSARMVARKRLRSQHVPLDAPMQEDESMRLSDMISDGRPDPEEQARRLELEQRLRRLSVQLSPTLGEVVRLCGLQGLSVRQAADALGVSVSAVKSRAVRARKELRRLDRVKPAAVTPPIRRRRTPRQPTTAAPWGC